MTDMMSEPEVEFRVGEVRVSLWHDPISDPNAKRANSHRVTIERQQASGHSDRYTDVLQANDIPKAILALKKAHDYLEVRKKEQPDAGEFKSATIHSPNPIP